MELRVTTASRLRRRRWRRRWASARHGLRPACRMGATCGNRISPPGSQDGGAGRAAAPARSDDSKPPRLRLPYSGQRRNHIVAYASVVSERLLTASLQI
jgi:hypothetical protein